MSASPLSGSLRLRSGTTATASTATESYPELDELRAAARGGKSWIAKFQTEQIRRTGIPSLKVDYHELVELEKTKPRLRNANVAVRESEGEVVFLHRIVPGGADQSYGIHVARLAGVPSPVLDRAREILKFLEKQHGPDPGAGTPAAEGPIRRKVKTGRALAGSLFAELPDPLLVELRQVDPSSLSPEQALDLVKRLRELAG